MIKSFRLFALIPLLFIFSNTNAQVDTSKLDLGRLMLDKNFTQTVTVKGSDLEKMPFDNLAEAINVWFYGSYTNGLNNVYVVDGNLVADVNIYSVYDIDEVTLVQNALTRTAGAVQQQQLILVKTKRAKGKGYGLTANAQAALSTHYTNNINDGTSPTSYQTGLKSNTTVYEQYYLSGYYNTGNIQSGISADFLRDAFPDITGAGQPDYSSPENFNRYRFNGYFTAKLGSSLLEVNASYVPENAGGDYSEQSADEYTQQAYQQHEHMFNANVKLTTRILPNFINVIHADYNSNHTDYQTTDIYLQPNDTVAGALAERYKSHSIVAYDNLSYNAKFGDWGVEPMVNLMFRSFADSLSLEGADVDTRGDVLDGFTSSDLYKPHMFLLTPSVNLYYKTWFNVQVGVLDNLSTVGFYGLDSLKKIFPFASASLDLAQLIKPGSPLSVKLYGAYSLSYFWLDDYNTLGDFSGSATDIPMIGLYNNKLRDSYQSSGNIDYRYFTNYLNSENKSFKNISAGITIKPLNSGLSFDYFFQQGAYLSPQIILAPAYVNTVTDMTIYNNTNAYLHRLAVNYTLNNSTFHWQTGLNATMLEQEYPVTYFTTNPSIGANEWTGGWVNRLSCHNLFAGVDVLYHVGETIYTIVPNTGTLAASRINSVSLQNVYLGYKLNAAHLKGLEIYADGRNLVQTKETDITDDRRYLGLGVKASL
jgi:hypothetical protein